MSGSVPTDRPSYGPPQSGPPQYGPPPGQYSHPGQSPYPGQIPVAPPPVKRSLAGLWIALSAVAVVIVIIVGAVVGVIIGTPDRATGPGDTSTAGVADDVVQISKQELNQLAQARTSALKGKNLKGFLAPLDQGNAELVAGQTRLYNNLRKVSFSESFYHPIDQVGRSADRFGRGVTVNLDVAFVHSVEGYDTKRVAEWYRWTVVKKERGAEPTITAVTGAPAPGGSYSKTVFYPAPWDKYADVAVVRSEHTVMLVDAALTEQAKKYSPIAERAAADVLASWRAGGQPGAVFERFVVSLVPDTEQLGTLYQLTKEVADEAGHSMSMPEFDGGYKSTPGGSRIVVDLSSSFFKTGDATGQQEIFRHEFTHSMVEGINRHDNPNTLLTGQELWIVEGFAEYVANRGVTSPNRRAAGAREIIRSGKFNDKLPGAGLIAAPVAGLTSFNYYLGHQAMRYIATKYGDPKAFALVTTYYQGGTVDAALQKVLGVATATFEREWATFVRAQTR